jgi:hypothetical protein
LGNSKEIVLIGGINVNLDFWIGFLKVISMLSAGLFGALATVTKSTDDKDKITLWGRIALSGIFVSTAVALGLHILETSKARSAAVQAKAESDATKRYLQSILGKAHMTADQQKISLDETNKLKVDLQETLRKTGIIKNGMATTLQEQQANSLRTSRIASDMKVTLRQQTDIVRGQEIAIATQEQQLDELRRLYLAQYRLGGLEVSWALSPVTLQRIRQIFESIRTPDKTGLEQLFNAGGRIVVGVKRGKDNQTKLSVSRWNRYGYVEKQYLPDSVEWSAFKKVLQLMLSPRFTITLAPDIHVAIISQPEVIIQSGGRERIVFTIQSPDLRLSQLKDAQWAFRADYSDLTHAPKKIRLRSLDAAVFLDSELEMSWEERETGEFEIVDEGRGDPLTAFFSGPHKLFVTFSRLLFP